MKKEEHKIKEFLIEKKFKGLRLDQFLAKKQVVKTRAQALKLISEKQVFLKKLNLKASYRLNTGDCLKVILPKKKSATLNKYDFPLDILFEDEEILIINKPAGLVVHPGPGHEEETLVNILFHKKNLSPGSHPLRPGIVHRLDKGTSGLLLLTKTKKAQDHLIKQFKDQSVKKEYWAISLHPPSPLKDTLETWIGRHPIHRKKFTSLKKYKSGFKKAITSYQLLRQHESGLSWVQCHLKTGRTHQIRVHLSSLSCPLVGDELYGAKKKLSFLKDSSLKEEVKNFNRLVLHAHSLSFLHPHSNKRVTWKSPWPEDLKPFLKKLDFYEK